MADIYDDDAKKRVRGNSRDTLKKTDIVFVNSLLRLYVSVSVSV